MSFLDKASPHTVALSEILREIHGNSPKKTHGSTSHFPWFSHLPKMAPCLGPGHLPWIVAPSDLGPAPSQRCTPKCPPVSWENTWENTWHFTNDTNLWGKTWRWFLFPIGSYWFLLVPIGSCSSQFRWTNTASKEPSQNFDLLTQGQPPIHNW